MVQGAVKKSKASSASHRPKAGPKRGLGPVAPKKAKLMKQTQMKKKFTAGLTARTEKSLAERAGHLELLKGGKNKAKTK